VHQNTPCPFILSLSTTALSPSACTRGESRGAHGGYTRAMLRVLMYGTKEMRFCESGVGCVMTERSDVVDTELGNNWQQQVSVQLYVSGCSCPRREGV
jgi:hypothetical protein